MKSPKEITDDTFRATWLMRSGKQFSKTTLGLQQLLDSFLASGKLKCQIKVTSIEAMDLERKLQNERDRAKKLVAALEEIKEREKPCPDNDPLGMRIIGDSYRIAREALKEYRGQK